MLQRFKQEIARALPKHLSAERMARIALTSFRKNPKLGQCDPKSVFAAVIMASQLGWEIGIGGQAYLIPYGRECQLVPGWMGLVDLVFRTGRASVWTGAVYEGDEFEYFLGDSPFIKHRPVATGDEAKLLYVYAVGRMNAADWPVIEVWPMAKVIAHRDKYNKVGRQHYSYQHLEMYARKVALLQVLKYMPKSTEMQLALQLDQAAGAGQQNISMADAIDATWVPEQIENEDAEPPEAPRSSTQAVKEQLMSRSEDKRRAVQTEEIWPKNPKDAA